MEEQKELLDRLGSEKINFEYEITARMSKYVLYFKLGILWGVTMIMLFIIHTLDVMSWITVVLILIIPVIYSVKILLEWIFEFYIISSSEVLHRKGILFIRKEIILLKNIEIIRLHQSILGRLLNYGTVELYAPTISQTFQMRAISTPNEYIKALEQAIKRFTSNIQFISKS